MDSLKIVKIIEHTKSLQTTSNSWCILFNLRERLLYDKNFKQDSVCVGIKCVRCAMLNQVTDEDQPNTERILNALR